jgi:hypothetical protein
MKILKWAHYSLWCSLDRIRPDTALLTAATLAVEQQDCSMLDWTSAVNGALLLGPEAP